MLVIPGKYFVTVTVLIFYWNDSVHLLLHLLEFFWGFGYNGLTRSVKAIVCGFSELLKQELLLISDYVFLLYSELQTVSYFIFALHIY